MLVAVARQQIIVRSSDADLHFSLLVVVRVVDLKGFQCDDDINASMLLRSTLSFYGIAVSLADINLVSAAAASVWSRRVICWFKRYQRSGSSLAASLSSPPRRCNRIDGGNSDDDCDGSDGSSASSSAGITVVAVLVVVAVIQVNSLGSQARRLALGVASQPVRQPHVHLIWDPFRCSQAASRAAPAAAAAGTLLLTHTLVLLLKHTHTHTHSKPAQLS